MEKYKERFLNINDLNNNLDSFEEIYKKYNILEEKIEETNKKIDEIKKDDHNALAIDKYENFRKEAYKSGCCCSSLDGYDVFLEKHPIVEEYINLGWDIDGFRRNQAELKRFFNMNADTFEFVLMHDKGRKYILELTNKEIIDITDYNNELANFMIECMKKCNSLFEITPADLPFLMAIKEDMNYEPDLSDMDPMDRAEERDLILTDIPDAIRREYNSVKKREEENRKPFDISPMHKEKLWNELLSKKLNDNEFWLEYYRLVIALGHDVEKLYIHAPEDRKQCVIEAYYYFAYEADYDEHFMVSSPMVNEEVLKMKHLKK